MQTELQITYRNFSHSDSLEAAIRRRVEKLDLLFSKITACHVVVEESNKSHLHGKKFCCAITLHVPGAELVVGHGHDDRLTHEDGYAAVGAAFDEITRKFEDHLKRARWDVKQHTQQEGTPHGRVEKLFVNEGPGTGYGFLVTHDGNEVYFHEHAVLHGQFSKLKIGTEVRFAEEDGDKGPQASTVAVTKRRARMVQGTSASADEIPESNV